jgi:hypothetical protein
VSLEAVLYQSAAGAAQAMRELRRAKQRCPAGYVQGRNRAVPPLRFRFGPAPDAQWRAVKGVDRFAVDVRVNDQEGRVEPGTLVYQTHGRVLVALYTSDDKTNAATLSRSVQAFTDVIAHRMLTLPSDIVDTGSGAV